MEYCWAGCLYMHVCSHLLLLSPSDFFLRDWFLANQLATVKNVSNVFSFAYVLCCFSHTYTITDILLVSTTTFFFSRWNAPDPIIFNQQPWDGAAHTSDLYFLMDQLKATIQEKKCYPRCEGVVVRFEELTVCSKFKGSDQSCEKIESVLDMNGQRRGTRHKKRRDALRNGRPRLVVCIMWDVVASGPLF